MQPELCSELIDLALRDFDGSSFVEAEVTTETIRSIREKVLDVIKLAKPEAYDTAVRDIMIVLKAKERGGCSVGIRFKDDSKCTRVKFTLPSMDSHNIFAETRRRLTLILDVLKGAPNLHADTIRTDVRIAFQHACEELQLADPDAYVPSSMSALFIQLFHQQGQIGLSKMVDLELLRFLRARGIMEVWGYMEDEIIDRDVWHLDATIGHPNYSRDPQDIINSYSFIQGTP